MATAPLPLLRPDGAGLDSRTVWRRLAAVLTAGAAAVHLGVTAAHFQEWWLFGVFFLLVAAAQLAWSFTVWSRPDRAVLLVGVLGSAALLLLWVVTRTVGLPFGPEPLSAQPWGLADGICAAFELSGSALSSVAMRNVSALRVMTRRRAVTVTAATAGMVLVGSGVAMAVPGHRGEAHADHAAAAMGTAGHSHGGGSRSGRSATGNGEQHHMANLPDVSAATAEQTRAATDLVTRLEAATASYRSVAAATKAGYAVDKAVGRWQQRNPGKPTTTIRGLHVLNPALLRDGRQVDPAAPETLIYNKSGDSWRLVGVMFRPNHDAAPPASYEPYLRWHYHAHCVTPGQQGRTDAAADGSCPAGTTPSRRGQSYMAHVWLVKPADVRYAYALTAPRAQVAAYQASLG